MTDHRSIARREALAYRIWAVAAPAGWSMTLREIADELGENINRVRGVSQAKGWNSRLRIGTTHNDGAPVFGGLIHDGFDGPARLDRGDMDATS
jgi:hypothetical protein